MNEFEIIDEYGYKYDEVLNDVLNHALKTEKVSNSIFSIIFIDNDKIQQINNKYRNINKPTDVISFAYEDNEKMDFNGFRVLGQIFVSISKMQEQAKAYNHSETRELCFLCVHGLFHLLGYDHKTKEEETIMFEKQEAVLNEFEKTKRV